jgi:hypothetical protein
MFNLETFVQIMNLTDINFYYLIEKTLIVILFKLSEAAPVLTCAPHPMRFTDLSLYSSVFVFGKLRLIEKLVSNWRS